MGLNNKTDILKEIPLFAALGDPQLNLIEQRSIIKEYKKGDIIYEEGSGPSAFYCILTGRVLIYTAGKDEETVLEYLHHGKYFGIISLLTKEPHSVSAKAINDSAILVIQKDEFDSILKQIPELALDISQTLSRRLKRKDVHQKLIFETMVISVFSSFSQVGKSVYSLNLGLGLLRNTRKKIIILDISSYDKEHSLPGRLGVEGQYPVCAISGSCAMRDSTEGLKEYIVGTKLGVDLLCLAYEPAGEFSFDRIISMISLLVNDYHYVILDLPCTMDRQVFRILNQSDLVHILTSPDAVDLERTHNLVERLKKEFDFRESKMKVIINEYKLSKLTYQEQSDILGQSIFATLPKIELCASDTMAFDAPTCEYAKVIRRVSRLTGDRLVGLALGVGVAYGFCHIGVLKVIEEEGIPIDIICGSSIGALIASLWATGKSSSEILEIASEFKEPNRIWNMVDLTFPLTGFIKGNKFYELLKRHFANMTFHDVRLPLKIVTSDMKRKKSEVLEKGLLRDAIMASCTMPALFLPFKFKNEMLFDGGVIHPVPVEPLYKSGVRKIIAVNVTPSREDVIKQYDLLKDKIEPAAVVPKKGWLSQFSLKGYLKEKLKTNILGIIFTSIEILQSELSQHETQLADVVLHPDTSGLYWLELHKSREFAKRGETEARRHLQRIWQVINE